MTATMQRKFRPIRNETPSHLYSIGQAVRLKGAMGIPTKAADVYQITGKLPHRGNSPQYRIRNDGERHERVAAEDSLAPVDTSPGDDATLIERTFGHGQGTETQQPRTQKAEAGEGSGEG